MKDIILITILIIYGGWLFILTKSLIKNVKNINGFQDSLIRLLEQLGKKFGFTLKAITKDK